MGRHKKSANRQIAYTATSQYYIIFPKYNLNLELQRSEVQGAIHEGSKKIRFPILLAPNNFT
jgi:hypothetical protein